MHPRRLRCSSLKSHSPEYWQALKARIRPGRPAELIAQNIPSPASMCYDAGANQLAIPMNANNALAFIPLN